MDIIEGLDHLPDLSKGTSVAIGNFDGMHLGHQKILQSLVHQGDQHDLATYVLTFSPHPRSVLSEGRLEQIQTLEQRLDGIKKYAVQGILIIKFDQVFARLTAEQFVEGVLLDSLHAKVVIVGENFHFGQKRRGNVRLLMDNASRYGFEVISIPSVIVDNINISSSQIRQLLKNGEVEKANRLMGRPYAIKGTVVKGDSKGKTLGFPTANILTPNDILPAGVFISRTHLESRNWPSLTNIGIRPTFQPKGRHVESYIIDFTEDLYSKEINVSFLKKIRDEKKFESPQALIDQIHQDLQTAKDFFKGDARQRDTF
jgi:riboflavin kinase/FMN adenylyltransferase